MKKRGNSWLWWLFGLGLILRLVLVVRINAHFDEVFTMEILEKCGVDVRCLIKADVSIPPLQYLWFWLTQRLSSNLAYLRVVNGLVFWMGVYWMGGWLMGKYSQKVRLVFSFLSAFSVYQIQFSWMAYVYGMMAFWTVLSWILVRRIIEKDEWWTKPLLLLVMVLGWLTHYSFLWATVAMFIWTLFRKNRDLMLVAATANMLILGYLWWIKEIIWSGYLNFYVDINSKTWGYFWGIVTNFLGGAQLVRWEWVQYVPFMFLVIVVGMTGWRVRERSIDSRWLGLMLLNVLVTLLMAGLMVFLPIDNPPNQVRTLIPAGLATLMVLSIFLDKVKGRWLITFLVLFVAINMMDYWNLYTKSRADKEGRLAARQVASLTDCTKKLPMKFSPSWFELIFKYYLEEYLGGGCATKAVDESDAQWWVVRSRYYLNSGQFTAIDKVDIKTDCPVKQGYWRYENEDLYLCGPNR